MSIIFCDEFEIFFRTIQTQKESDKQRNNWRIAAKTEIPTDFRRNFLRNGAGIHKTDSPLSEAVVLRPVIVFINGNCPVCACNAF